jgi:Protein of unknown function (DUF2827)
LKRINVGISIFASADASIWNSGLNQNIAFLIMAFRKLECVQKIFLINGGDATTLSKDLQFEALDVELVRPEQVTEQVDLVIEMGATLPLEWLKILKTQGKRVVGFHVGQPYIGQAETAIFNRSGGAPFNGAPWDEVWLLPQYMHSAAAMLQTIYRAPVYAMPHIWSPYFLDGQIQARPDMKFRFGFQPSSNSGAKKAWRIAIFEPNISVAKNCFIPMLICEAAHRSNPNVVGHMMVLNSVHMKNHPTFQQFAIHLDVTRAGRASYEQRISFLDCMVGQSMDAIVSHQWENAQNYVYYEALYGGYPLFHNSSVMKEAGMGFYYPEFSAKQGAVELIQAWNQSELDWTEYKSRARQYLQTVLPDHERNLCAFQTRLMAGGV